MASSTYLQLVNKVLSRVNEVELTDSTFADARGVHAAAKQGVLETIRRINTVKVQWPFNQLTGQQVLSVGQVLYEWPSAWKDVDWDSFYIEKDDALSISTRRLDYLEKDTYYRTMKPSDLDESTDGSGLPLWVFESNAGGFGVTPAPDQAYTVRFFYSRNDIAMTVYSDQTTIPDIYDYVIVDGALAAVYLFYDNQARADSQEAAFTNGLNTMARNLIPSSKYALVRQVNRGGGAQYGRWGYMGYTTTS